MTTCEQFQVAISAHHDGESAGVPAEAVARHVMGCPRCAAYAAACFDLPDRVPALEEASDRTAGVLAAIGAVETERDRTGSIPMLRVVLAVLGVFAILFAIPSIVGADATLPMHVERHVGAFEIALGVGFLTAAWRPRAALGLLPFTATLVAFVVWGAVYDMITGSIAGPGEAQHVIEIGGVVVLWLLVREQRWQWVSSR